MAAPKVNYCIIAGTVRVDPGNAIAILGFHGIVPGVSLGCKRFPANVELGFLLNIDSSGVPKPKDPTGHKVEVWISDSNNLKLMEEDRWIAGSERNIVLGTIYRYPAPGEYRLHLEFDGVEFYMAPYKINLLS